MSGLREYSINRDGAGPAAGLDDIRLLATTYRGLAQARSAKQDSGTPGTPTDQVGARHCRARADSRDGPNRVGRPGCPAAWQDELAIDERGIVTKVSVKTSVNARYDDRLSRALRRIRFQPATRAGIAVAYKWTLAVSAGEIPSLSALTAR